MTSMLRGFVRHTIQQEERHLTWTNVQKESAEHFDGDYSCRCPYPGEEIPPIINPPIDIPGSGKGGSKASKGGGKGVTSKGGKATGKGKGGTSKGSKRRALSRAPYWHHTCEDIVWICPGDPIPDLPRWMCPLPIPPPATSPTPASIIPPTTSASKGSKGSKAGGKGKVGGSKGSKATGSKGSKAAASKGSKGEGKGSEIERALNWSAVKTESKGSKAQGSKGSKGQGKGQNSKGSKGSKGKGSEGKGGETYPPTPAAIIPPPSTGPRYWDYLPSDRCNDPPTSPGSTPSPTYDGSTPYPTNDGSTPPPTPAAIPALPTSEPTGESTAVPTSEDTSTFPPSYEGCIETIVNFDTDSSGNALSGGTCVQNEWIDLGFTVSSNGDTAFPCLVDTMLVEEPGLALGR